MVLLSACATVEVKDHEVCGDMGLGGASCFHTLTTESRDVAKDAWDAERFGQLCVKPEVYADWKSTIEKLCSASKRCTYEDKKLLEDLQLKIDGFVARAERDFR